MVTEIQTMAGVSRTTKEDMRFDWLHALNSLRLVARYYIASGEFSMWIADGSSPSTNPMRDLLR